MNRIYITAGLLALGVALGGCSSGNKNDAANSELLADKTQGKVVLVKKTEDLAQIANKLWVLSSWNTAEGEVTLPDRRSVTFELKDGIGSGRSPVNQYRISLEVAENGALAWEPGLSTMMAGKEEDMAFERRYLDTLPKVISIGVDESGQMIFTTETDALIFAPGKMFFAGDGLFNF